MQVSTTIDCEKGNGMVVKRLSVPIGLEELMESLTKQVLLKKPTDLYAFASQHFAHLVGIRDAIAKDAAKKPVGVKSATSATKFNTLPTPILFTNAHNGPKTRQSSDESNKSTITSTRLKTTSVGNIRENRNRYTKERSMGKKQEAVKQSFKPPAVAPRSKGALRARKSSSTDKIRAQSISKSLESVTNVVKVIPMMAGAESDTINNKVEEKEVSSIGDQPETEAKNAENSDEVERSSDQLERSNEGGRQVVKQVNEEVATRPQIAAANRIQSEWRRFKEHQRSKQDKSNELKLVKAATLIQALSRGFLVRNHLKQKCDVTTNHVDEETMQKDEESEKKVISDKLTANIVPEEPQKDLVTGGDVYNRISRTIDEEINQVLEQLENIEVPHEEIGEEMKLNTANFIAQERDHYERDIFGASCTNADTIQLEYLNEETKAMQGTILERIEEREDENPHVDILIIDDKETHELITDIKCKLDTIRTIIEDDEDVENKEVKDENEQLLIRASNFNNNDEDIKFLARFISAATTIQSCYRGFRVRNKKNSKNSPGLQHSSEFHDTLLPVDVFATVGAPPPAGVARVSVGSAAHAQRTPVDDGAHSAAADTRLADKAASSAPICSSSSSMETAKRNNSAIHEKNEEALAATKIQASFRGYQVRKQMMPKPKAARRKTSGTRSADCKRLKDGASIEEKSATKIQAGVRGFLVRRRNQKNVTAE